MGIFGPSARSSVNEEETSDAPETVGPVTKAAAEGGAARRDSSSLSVGDAGAWGERRM